MKRVLVAFCLTCFFLLPAGSSGAAKYRPGTICGHLMMSPGVPMGDAMLFVYNLASGPVPSHYKYWRVPNLAEAVEVDGRFCVELQPGEYCIAAVKRHGPPRIGPPEDGDSILLDMDEMGTPKRHAIGSGETLDLGMLYGARPFLVNHGRQGVTGIEGTIQHANGKPVEDAVVFAFLTPNVIGKPLFVSDRSLRDGRFLLRLPEGGTYYLKIRQALGGGPPGAGEILDGNREESLHPVDVKTGEITRGVVLKGKAFPGRGELQESGRKNKLRKDEKKGGEVW